MPTDEGTHGVDADASRERTGPRHAAPRKPLLARLHVPAGKAIALAAMPTVLVGMGLSATLARAEGQQQVAKSMTAEEYQACVEAMAKGPSASPSPSASEDSAESGKDDAKKDDAKKDAASGAKDGSSSDSGSDEKGGDTGSGSGGKVTSPAPSPSPSADDGKTEESGGSGGGTGASPSPSPSPSEESKGLLETIGDTLTDVFTGGGDKDASTPSASPSPSAPSPAGDSADAKKETAGKDAAKETPAADDTPAAETSPSPSPSPSSDSSDDSGDDKEADASPSPSPSASTDVDDCPEAATDEEGGIDNKMRLPDDPWYLNASGLTLKGADYQGIVKVKTANGTVKEVLKYVISDGTDIDDLHQTVIDKQAGKTYHVKGAKGSKSTITGGKTVMYTESISGNLLGLIPVTFSPKSPPPLNIPWIYFSNVKVVQAGQFGGTLHIPGMSQSIT
ncbi:hypothetical protein IAG44_12060 [Streptomyces roseirectus]|uniref:Membrane-bound hydrophilic protein n=1 Tax=Streptomyces roseirectus TaxID=2768066 RepID=A0A7H0IBE6_9ACTN|nr:hypothetical protein [Streptomyces roseirectus]QNP70112.1 hypothetical protein IAG44_12060 [Streptomyces roseirectus]